MKKISLILCVSMIITCLLFAFVGCELDNNRPIDDPKDPTGPVDPEKPDPVDPDKPDPVDPDKPDPVDPDKPDPVDPDKPDPVDPDKPDPVDPDKPDPDPEPEYEFDSIKSPSNYRQYLTKSNSTTNEDGDFIRKNEMYEVGTDNGFIFEPVVGVFDEDNKKVTLTSGAFTIDKFYIKEGATYVPFNEEQLKLVTVNGHIYYFADELIGKTVKLELTIDDTKYYVDEEIPEKDRMISCEFVLVNGYNVYDQKGLSVMDDIVSSWAELKNEWGTLKADTKPLVEYTDVENIILHTSIELDPNLFPREYFWTTDKETGYSTVLEELKASDEELGYASKLYGSLRDFTVREGSGDRNYYLSDNGAHVNMQKGLFNTSKCSVSGNYYAITVVTEDSGAMTPEAYKAKYGSRNLYSVYSEGATENVTTRNNPISHWSLFKLFKSQKMVNEGAEKTFEIKNLSASGSMGRVEGNGRPAGIMFVNSASDRVILNNVVGDRFNSAIVHDTRSGNSEDELVFNETKLLNAYNNMVYAWRSNITVNKSVMKYAGGPIFMLCDGERDAHPGDYAGTISVDDESELLSLAIGTESWYMQWNATAIVNSFRELDGYMNAFGKTIKYIKGADGEPVAWDGDPEKSTYINMVAVIMPEPGILFNDMTGGTHYNAAGTFVNKDAQGNTVNEFNTMSPQLQGAQAASTIAFQSGNNFAYMGPGNSLLVPTNMGVAPLNPSTDGVAWATTSTDYLFTYLFAGLTMGRSTPYFGVVTDLNTISAH